MIEKEFDAGEQMYKWAKDLFPINRSITGPGVRKTLSYLQQIVPELQIKSIPSGKKVFDWTTPKEWRVNDAYIITPNGEKVADFKKNNLHLVGYSEPVNKKISYEELMEHIYTLPEMPDAIPYITSYYNKTWGFCLSYNELSNLSPGTYEVYINSTLKKGVLNYGEIIIPGKEKSEVLLSTYICHPSMANNELSGPVVTTKILKWLQKQKNLRYTYRVVLLPETIGSISYIHENFKALKQNVIGGFVITCVGDDNNYSLLNSKWGNTLFDRIGENAINHHTNGNYKQYSFLERGSDERQYSSVGVDIPVISLMRSKYGEYKEYHTSLDNLNFISPQGLQGGFELHKKALRILEYNYRYKMNQPCEPQLGKRGLYPTISTRDTQRQVETMMNIIAYADGENELIDFAQKIGADGEECIVIIDKLLQNNLIKIV